MNNGSAPLYSDITVNKLSRHVEIHNIEKKIGVLVKYCQDLKSKNSTLEAEHDKLKREKAKLLEKNQAAKTKIEKMINQLNSMEGS